MNKKLLLSGVGLIFSSCIMFIFSLFISFIMPLVGGLLFLLEMVFFVMGIVFIILGIIAKE